MSRSSSTPSSAWPPAAPISTPRLSAACWSAAEPRARGPAQTAGARRALPDCGGEVESGPPSAGHYRGRSREARDGIFHNQLPRSTGACSPCSRTSATPRKAILCDERAVVPAAAYCQCPHFQAAFPSARRATRSSCGSTANSRKPRPWRRAATASDTRPRSRIPIRQPGRPSRTSATASRSS